MKQKLIINADDYGMSPFFNKAIHKLARAGIVTSTTVLINSLCDPQQLRETKNISIGLHLDIKDGKSIEKQVEHQINSFQRKFSHLPSHLDGHGHRHIDPKNISTVIDIAKKYNLPVRSKERGDRNILRAAKIKTPDAYISWHPTRKELFLEKLKNTRGAIIELVCHPGYYDKDCEYPYNKSREEEIKILKSPEFLSVTQKFQLVSYTSVFS